MQPLVRREGETSKEVVEMLGKLDEKQERALGDLKEMCSKVETLSFKIVTKIM